MRGSVALTSVAILWTACDSPAPGRVGAEAAGSGGGAPTSGSAAAPGAGGAYATPEASAAEASAEAASTSQATSTGAGTHCVTHDECFPSEICRDPGICTGQSGPIYDVPHRGLPDHGDPADPGSIAWWLAHLNPGESARLVDDVRYEVAQQLTVRAGTSLIGQPGVDRVISAAPALDAATLLRMEDSTRISDLVLDGAHEVRHILVASGVAGIVVEDCVIQRTKNDWPAGSDPRCHGIVLSGVTAAVLRRNVVQQIGYPKQAPRDWPGVCAGIDASDARDLIIADNTVRDVLTAGIDFTGTIGAQILGNHVRRSGRNIEYWVADYDLPVADGITAYHNLADVDQDLWVVGNTVTDSGNHGIHLSGPGVHILGNVVEDPFAQGVFLGDQRTPSDCAHACEIKGNQITGLLQGGNRHAVYVGQNHHAPTVEVADNAPDDVFWRPSSACSP